MIFDLHNDILTADIPAALLDSELSNNASSDSFIALLVAWTTKTASPIDTIPRIFKKADCIRSCNFAIEDLHFIDRSSFSFFESIKRSFNVLYAGLTWNFENALAGGAFSNARLSSLGRDVIRELEKARITIDTAHLNRESFWDVLRFAKMPVINSHCCFSALTPHPRNLDDSQIKAVIESGGIIGLTFVPEFLTSSESFLTSSESSPIYNSNKPTAKMLDVFNHIDYFVSRFGYQNLAIGSDFYGSTSYPENLSCYKELSSTSENSLISLMKARGYKDDAVEAIFSKNAQNFFF